MTIQSKISGRRTSREATWPPLSETRAEAEFEKPSPMRAGAGGKDKERASAGGKGKEPTSAEHPEQTSSRRSPTEQCPHEPRPPAQAPHLKRLPGRAGMEWRSCQTTKRKFHGTTTPRSPPQKPAGELHTYIVVSYIHTYTHTYTPETHCWCSRW